MTENISRRSFVKVAGAAVGIIVAGGAAGFGLARSSQAKGSVEGQRNYDWPIASNSTESTITHVFATAFADELSSLSNGEMGAKVFANSTLGSDRETMECLKSGDIPFAVMSPSPQVSFMPRLCVFDTPCVYRDITAARATIDGTAFSQAVNSIYEQAGYHLLGIADQCFRVMTSNIEFTGFESLRGQKVRTMENSYHLMFWSAMGANPTPMAFSELYIGLQQGTVDAQENSYGIVLSSKFYEQQKYLIDTNVIPDYVMLVASDAFYGNLNDDARAVVDTAAANARIAARVAADERKSEYLNQLVEKGMTHIVPDDAAWDAMVAHCDEVYEAIRQMAGDELIDAYMG